MIWTHHKVQTLWKMVTDSMGKIIGNTAHCDSVMCLLNYIVKGTWSKYTKQIIKSGCMTVKRLIATN